MKDVSVVIDELGKKWQGLTKEQKTNTLVNVAGVHHQNRLAALMNNYQMAIDSTTTSMDSQGSAMREQEKFNASLQGRLNQLNTAWVDLSSTVGQTVLYDSIVVVTKALESMSDGGNNVVSTVGLLPPLFGTAYTAVFLLSTGFRTLTISMGTAVGSAIATTVATGSLTTGITALRASVAALGITWKSFLAATGVGAVFIGIGFAIEKLTKVMSENIQQQEEFDLYLDKNTKALTDNKQQVDELIAQYTSLSSSKANSDAWNSDKEQKYLEVQQKLGEIFPALIDKVDATGQTHLKSAKAIEEEIKATEKLVEAQNKVTRETAKDEFKKLNDSLSGGMFDSFNNFVNGSLKTQIEGTKNVIKLLKKQGDDDLVAENELKLLQLEQQYQQASEEIKGYIFEVSNSYSNLEIDPKISESLQGFVSSLDLSGFDETQLNTFAKDFSAIQDKIQKAVDTDNEKMYDGAIKSLHDLASETNNFDGDLESFKMNYKEFIDTIENGGTVFIDAEGNMEVLAGSVEGAVESVYELKTAMEQLAGVSQQQIVDTDDLLFQYNQLTAQMQGYTEAEIENMLTKGNLSSEEQFLVSVMQDRAGVMSTLDSIYPSLLDKDGKAIVLSEEKIKAIQQENKANEVLLKAYKLARDGKLTAEQSMTVASAQSTKARIDNIKTEIQALNVLQQALQATYNEQAKLISQKGLDEVREKYGENSSAYRNYGKGAYETGRLLGQTQSKVSSYASELDSLQSQLNTNIGKIDTFSTAIEDSGKKTNKTTDSTKKANKTTKESIYITDKYKQSLEKLNLEIEKQQKIQSKFPDYSNEYKKSLESQIKLEKQKLALIEKQGKSIQSQISSGKIKQTGTVTTKNNTTTSTNKNLSGWNGRITSRYGERADNHRGTDIASPKGTRLDSNASGRVIASGNASKNGYHGSYGNLVVVQGDDGIKRLYAHLEKAIAKIGDVVTAGTQLGTIGSTGNSTGPHLHYEEFKNGKLIDSTAGANAARKGKAIVSSGGTTTTTVDNSQQAIDQAKSDLTGLQSDALNTKSVIDGLSEELVNSNLSYFEHLINGVDKSIDKSNKLANLQLEHSKEYRDELTKEVKHQEYKQSLLHKEANFIRTQLKRTDLTPKLKGELSTQLSELSLSWWDVAEAIDNVKEEIEKSKIAEFDKKIEKLNDTISKSNSIMELHAKGTKEYNDEQKKVISTLKLKQKEYESEAQMLREVLATEKLTVKSREKNIERLKELSDIWSEIQSEIINTNAELADDLLGTMKESYEKQRDYQIALKDEEIKKAEEAFDKQMELLDEEDKAYEESIKSQMDELDKAHQDKLDKLDEESKAFEDAINRQLELMRNQRDEEDFNKDIGNLQKEESTIISKINELTMDDSREAQLKRKTLEEELANIREQIAEKQRDRDYTLREENLQNELDSNNSELESKKDTEDKSYELAKEALDKQLDIYKKELEAKRKLEEDKLNATKEQLEKERRDIEIHFDELINNEKAYADLRKQIINGSVDDMRAKLSTFLEYFKGMNKDVVNDLGLSWQELENQINRILQAQGSLGNISIPNSDKDLTRDPSGNTPKEARDKTWQQYLSNKKNWESASAKERERLGAENEQLRNKWGFQDGSYDSLKNIKKYHGGGIIGDKGNRLTELTNKLFNNKPSEQTVIALKRELFVPENNIPNMFANIRSVLPDFKSNSPQGGTIRIDNLISIDNVSQNANLNIDRLLDQGLNRLIDKMKPYGFKL